MPAALAKRKFTVNVAGLRTDVDEHVLPPNAGVLELENCVFDVSGAVSKRRGFSALSSSIAPSGTIPNVWQLATHQDSLIALSTASNKPLYKWSPTTGRWLAANASTGISSIALSTTDTFMRGPFATKTFPWDAGGTSSSSPDFAFSGNYFAVAFGTNNGISVGEAIVDAQTGKQLYSAQAPGVRARVIAINGAFVVVFVDSGSVVFDKWTIANLATVGTSTTTTNVASAHATDPFLDVTATGADTIAVAYQHTDNTIHYINYTVSTGVVASSGQMKNNAGVAFQATQCLGWVIGATLGSPILLVASSALGVVGHVFGSGVTANATVTTTIDAAATASVRNVSGWTVGGTDYSVLYEVTGTAGILTLTKAATKIGGVVTTGTFARSVGLRTRPFKGPDLEWYAVFSVDSATQSSDYLIWLPTNLVTSSFPNNVPQARSLTWRANGKTELAGHLASFLTYGTGGIASLIARTRVNSVGGARYFDTAVTLIQFGFSDRIGRFKEAAGYTFVPGGVLTAFDGQKYLEPSWHVYPESVTSAQFVGGGLVVGATYNWKFVYRWIDSQGRIHRSVPSDAVQVTITAGNGSVLFAVPNAQLTSLKDPTPTAIEMYRTISGGTDYFLETTVPNDINNSTHNMNSTLSDAALGSGELLYTTGGVLASQPPPPLFAIEQFDQRLVGIDAEDRGLIRMTSQFVDGIAPAWNENLTIRLNTQWGDATGLAVMDDKLLIFFRNAIYYIAGVGPDASGNGSYNAPALIATGTGCAEAQCQSVIYTGTGVMFLSDVGFQNIDRGLNVRGQQITDIGAGVQRYTDAGITVVGAIQDPANSQIRFFTAEGTTLIWDYLHQAWTVSTAQPSQTAVMWGQTPVCALAATVYAEDGSFMERGARYEQKITLPWLSLAGLRGYQRLWRVQPIGETSSLSGGNMFIVATFAYDFDVSTAHDQTATAVGSGVIWQWAARPMRQLATAFRFGLRGLANDDNDHGFTFIGATFEYGAKNGLYPDDKAKRAV